jgi:hypothetical protein
MMRVKGEETVDPTFISLDGRERSASDWNPALPIDERGDDDERADRRRITQKKPFLRHGPQVVSEVNIKIRPH